MKSKHKHTTSTLDMTTGSPLRLLLRFSLPLFAGNLLQQFYNLADTSIAGALLGDTALAQIGATAALYSLITNIAFGLNNGLALSVSNAFGASDSMKLKQSTCWMICLSGLFSLIMAFGFLFFQNHVLHFMKIPSDTISGARDYLTIILIGIPFTMAYNAEAGLLQALGNSITPLKFLAFSSILNILLDFICMGPAGLGVRGAAIATISAQAISALLCFLYIYRHYPDLRFTKEAFNVKPGFVWHMLFTGINMALMNGVYNIGSVILQSSVNSLGNVYITAQVGGRKLAELFHIPGLAIGTAAATYASQNYGAKRISRIKQGLYVSCMLLGVWWILALIFAFGFSPAAVKMITSSSNPLVLENAVLYIKASFPVFPPMFLIIIIRNILQGMQHSIPPLICSILELVGKVIFALWIVPVYGYLAVCICEPVLWVICCIYIVISYKAITRKKA